MSAVSAVDEQRYCSACFSGVYPVDIEVGKEDKNGKEMD
jgi:glutamine phosphoribosylpyrophosphate amidotransferase